MNYVMAALAACLAIVWFYRGCATIPDWRDPVIWRISRTVTILNITLPIVAFALSLLWLYLAFVWGGW